MDKTFYVESFDSMMNIFLLDDFKESILRFEDILTELNNILNDEDYIHYDDERFSHGLCKLLSFATSDIPCLEGWSVNMGYKAVLHYSPTWSKFSGSQLYPVKHIDEGEVFWGEEYIKIRIELLEHVISEMKLTLKYGQSDKNP